MLVKPQTYMNLSGESVLEMLEDLEEEPGLEDLLVVTDDAALPLGSMRFRPRGSCGGHNGLASIEQSLASDGYPRLRIGVGPATEGIPLKEFVLGGFSEREEDMLSSVIPTAAKAVRLWVEEGIEACQREYNGWRFEPGDSENAEPDPETRNPDTEE
jgi:PTH1 family peptidyl-tRNA hydrolase